MRKLNEVRDSLFSVSGTAKHSTTLDLEPGQLLDFKGSGVVVGVSFEGFADDTKTPVRLFKIQCDYLELV